MTKPTPLRVVIMGCGGSGGVPYPGNIWGVCDPNNPKNRRTRPSIYIEQGETRIVVDTGPDFRNQINSVGAVAPLAGVLYTHAHADHINGIDDLKSFWYSNGKKLIDAYANAETIDALERYFPYAVESDKATAVLTVGKQYPKTTILHEAKPEFMINDVKIQSFDVYHDRDQSMLVKGYRIGDFGYTTDTTILTDDAFRVLNGVKVWVVGIHDHPEGGFAHPALSEVIEWNKRIGAENVVITHMAAGTDYEDLKNRSPKGVEPAYDGMEFILND